MFEMSGVSSRPVRIDIVHVEVRADNVLLAQTEKQVKQEDRSSEK